MILREAKICEYTTKIYGGNFSAAGQYVANRNRLNKAEQLKAKEFLVLNTEKSRASSDHLPLIFDFELI